MNNRELGLFIGRIRAEKNISVEALCEGVCAQSFLSSIEAGKKSTNKLMRDILLQRLGVPDDGYEGYLSQTEYRRWKRRCDIVNFLENSNTYKAKKELELYINDVGDKNKLHLQYILYMESRIAVLEQKDYKTAYEKIRQAVCTTVPEVLNGNGRDAERFVKERKVREREQAERDKEREGIERRREQEYSEQEREKEREKEKVKKGEKALSV